MSHFNLSLNVWAKPQDSVHKSQFLKRKESRSGSNRGPFAYQPSALPLGHPGSRFTRTSDLLHIVLTTDNEDDERLRTLVSKKKSGE